VKKLTAFLTATALASSTTGAMAAPKVLKIEHFQTGEITSPAHAASLAFESCIESKTNGAIDVQIYPAGQLGADSETMEALELGNLQMAILHDGPISAVYKPFEVLAMPYIFDDQAMAWSVMDGPFGQELAADMLEQTGVRMLGVGDNGVRNFTNDARPISSPEDMKGLKIRVQTAPVWVALVESLGASATPVAWAELPGALQQGVVDGQENGVTNILNASLYQSQKYASLDGHVFSWHAYLINNGFYEGLNKDEQIAVDQCSQIAITIHRGMTAAQDANAQSLLTEKGMEVTPFTPEQKEQFRQLAQPAVRKFIEQDIGTEWPQKLDEAISDYRESFQD